MANEARHHHYIPKCYLRGFAIGGGKHARVTVANLESGCFFEANPRNIGGVRDFNRIQIEGFKPDALEGMLSGFESQVAEAIRNVSATHKFEGDDRNAILNLGALLAVRSPEQRENIRQFDEKIMKQILGLSLQTKERWESQLKEMEKAGKGIKNPLPYEDMVAFFKEDDYKITMNTEHYIGLELKSHDVVLKALAARKWKLYITNEEKGYFVTSDRPVVITWNNPHEIPVMMRNSPGFGATGTEVLFPIAKDLLVIGSFEQEEGTVETDSLFVGAANSKVIHFSFGQVYAFKRTFPYWTPDAKFHNDRHFMERYEPWKKKPMDES